MIGYLSGTGNTRYVAERLGQRLGEPTVDLCSLEAPFAIFSTLILVFPVYGWAPPQMLCALVERLQVKEQPQRLYYVAVCGDDTGKTSEVLCRSLHRAGLRKPDGGFSVTMPNTYICLPGFDVDPKDVEERKLQSVDARLDYIASRMREGEVMERADCHEGAFPCLKTYVLGAFFRRFLMQPEKFRATEACVGCGRCSQVCPLHNIRLEQGRPAWGAHCLHCLACYHACPHHAVDYAGRTVGKGQFQRFLNKHHGSDS
jgi:Fe-S-cluster-containing hydrogenase component 2